MILKTFNFEYSAVFGILIEKELAVCDPNTKLYLCDMVYSQNVPASGTTINSAQAFGVAGGLAVRAISGSNQSTDRSSTASSSSQLQLHFFSMVS